MPCPYDLNTGRVSLFARLSRDDRCRGRPYAASEGTSLRNRTALVLYPSRFGFGERQITKEPDAGLTSCSFTGMFSFRGS